MTAKVTHQTQIAWITKSSRYVRYVTATTPRVRGRTPGPGPDDRRPRHQDEAGSAQDDREAPRRTGRPGNRGPSRTRWPRPCRSRSPGRTPVPRPGRGPQKIGRDRRGRPTARRRQRRARVGPRAGAAAASGHPPTAAVAAAASMSLPEVGRALEPDDDLAVEPHRGRRVDAGAAASAVSDRAACLGRAGRDARLPGRDVKAGRGRDRRQPVGREGALVLAGLVGEDPVLEGPVARPASAAHRAPARGLDQFVVWRRLLAPWNAASWWTIRSVPGVTYLVIRAGSTVRANWPQTGHWKSVQTSSVTGASTCRCARPSARAVGVGCAGSIRLAASVVVAPPWVSNSPAITITPMDATSRVMSRMGEPRRCWRTMGLPELAEGRPAARRLARVVGGGVEILVLSGGLLGSRP